MSTEFNEPNRFCGECHVYLCVGEPETSPEQNEQLLRECKECKAWRSNAIQLMNTYNVGQCWHCANQIAREMLNPVEGEKVCVPFCGVKNSFIKKLDDIHCPEFKLKDDSLIRCSACTEALEQFEHCVEYEGKIFCENCFFDIALEKLGAKSLQLDSNGELRDPEEEDEEESFVDIYEDMWR